MSFRRAGQFVADLCGVVAVSSRPDKMSRSLDAVLT